MVLLNQYSSGLSDTEVATIIETIGRERLTYYLAQTASDREALSLYQVNGELSKHVHEVIGGFEIALRNLVAKSLASHLKRDDWYRCRAFMMKLSLDRRANVREVRYRLKTASRPERPGRVVAGLTFHFWVSMHEKKYRDLIWTPHLHKIWPTGENLKSVHRDLIKVRDLRNRIAHHEPIVADGWHRRADIIWDRFRQITPESAAWYQRRLSGQIASLRNMSPPVVI